MKYFLFILYFFLHVSPILFSIHAQINVTQETQFYLKLIETGEKLNELYENIEDVKSKTSFYRDAVYKVNNMQPINSLSGTQISTQAEILINHIVTYADNYDLPELEKISVHSFPLNGNKQSVSQLLSSLTEATIFYNNKLKDYKKKRLETNTLKMKLIELKRETSKAAEILRKVLESGGLAFGREAIFNDWFNFNTIFSKRIGNSIQELNTKKKKWERALKERRSDYQIFKSNVITGLQLEKASLQKTYDEAEKQAKEYTKEIEELEKQIKNLEILKSKIQTIESDIKYYTQQIISYERTNNSYRSSLTSLEKEKTYIQSKEYELNYGRCNNNVCPYGKCPNNFSYQKCCGRKYSSDCSHKSQGVIFRNKRSSDKRRVETHIKSYQIRITNNNSIIKRYRNTLSSFVAKKQQIENQLIELPGLQQKLKSVQDESSKFIERLDIFYAFELMFTNNQNINSLEKL